VRENRHHDNYRPQNGETEADDEEHGAFRAFQQAALALKGCSLGASPGIGHNDDTNGSYKRQDGEEAITLP
jgi:hypothetical protein